MSSYVHLSVKFLLLLAASAAYHYGQKPPVPPASEQNIVYKGQLFERLVRKITWFWKTSFILVTLCHITTVTSTLYPAALIGKHALPSICANRSPLLVSLTTVTPRFVLGSTIMLASGLLRRWCFVTMGRLFTYEVSIKNDHQLVTSGPYGYVRHPSYTGGLSMLVAAYLMHFGENEYIPACNIMSTPAMWLVYLWGASALYGFIATYRRTVVEDEALRARFGGAWDEYRRKVPYRFVPYII